MNKRDCYEVLQVARDAAPIDIKKAYRKLAHKYHPDRNQDDKNAESKFKEVSEAYEVLSDPQKKEQYDTFGHNVPRSGSRGYANPFVDPFDMFNSFFRNEQIRRKGRDLRVEVNVNLEDVLSGANKKITYLMHSKCQTCKGIGGTGSTCKQCGGYGQVQQQSGFFRMVTTCPKCQGSRIEITKECPKCKGQGEIGEKKTITVEIPPGICTGNHIKIAGGGDLTEDKLPPGDLLCRINVEPHPVFQRKDKDIQCVHEISFADACLGTKIMIPTLGGQEEEFIIPPGTQFGQYFRVKGRGVPTLSRSHHPSRGHQFIKVHISVPKDLTLEEQDTLKRFDEEIKDRA